MRSALFLILCLGLLPFSVHAQLCPQWQTPREVGHLNVKLIDEASGLVSSEQFQDRLYWVNDSGDKGSFYVSKADGSSTRRILIEGFKPWDTEALTLWKKNDETFLVVGDIGDNRGKRSDLTLVFIKEVETFSDSVKPARIIKVQYPDGPRDAEAMTALPNGDLLILSKEIQMGFLAPGPAGVYVLKASELEKNAKSFQLTKMGTLPLPTWLKDQYSFGQVVTDAAVNLQRQVLGLLTYQKAVEIPLKNLERLKESTQWKLGVDFGIVPLQVLTQQETMTYLKGEDRVVWSTEQSMQEAPIFSMTCSTP